MSHVRVVEVKVKNPRLLQIVCQKLGLPFSFAEPGKKLPVKIYNTTVEADASFQLKDWSYPCAVNFANGDIHMDNYNGSWGDEKEMQKFHQQHSIEEAREYYSTKERMRCESEEVLENGMMVLTMVD